MLATSRELPRPGDQALEPSKVDLVIGQGQPVPAAGGLHRIPARSPGAAGKRSPAPPSARTPADPLPIGHRPAAQPTARHPTGLPAPRAPRGPVGTTHRHRRPTPDRATTPPCADCARPPSPRQRPRYRPDTETAPRPIPADRTLRMPGRSPDRGSAQEVVMSTTSTGSTHHSLFRAAAGAGLVSAALVAARPRPGRRTFRPAGRLHQLTARQARCEHAIQPARRLRAHPGLLAREPGLDPRIVTAAAW